VDFGLFTEGGSSDREFTIRNPGGDLLTLSGVTFSGTHAADFTVTAGPPASLATGTAGILNVRFQPATAGIRSATLEIASNDADENPFLIELTGRTLSYTEDSDGDGLSDAAEFDMAALGFDWQVSQPELVDVLFANANGANLYRLDQVQALNVNTPLISRDPGTGRFKLTLGLRKSTNLADEVPFPMTPAQTAINGDGKLEFEFDGTEDAAFFRVGAE